MGLSWRRGLQSFSQRGGQGLVGIPQAAPNTLLQGVPLAIIVNSSQIQSFVNTSSKVIAATDYAQFLKSGLPYYAGTTGAQRCYVPHNWLSTSVPNGANETPAQTELLTLSPTPIVSAYDPEGSYTTTFELNNMGTVTAQAQSDCAGGIVTCALWWLTSTTYLSNYTATLPLVSAAIYQDQGSETNIPLFISNAQKWLGNFRSANASAKVGLQVSTIAGKGTGLQCYNALYQAWLAGVHPDFFAIFSGTDSVSPGEAITLIGLLRPTL